jgi:hypothetical protein
MSNRILSVSFLCGLLNTRELVLFPEELCASEERGSSGRRIMVLARCAGAGDFSTAAVRLFDLGGPTAGSIFLRSTLIEGGDDVIEVFRRDGSAEVRFSVTEADLTGFRFFSFTVLIRDCKVGLVPLLVTP